MHSIRALIRAAFLSAASYRLGLALSFIALLASVVPIYFISGALQPVVADSIRPEGGAYFGFLLVGIGASYLLATAAGALPSAVGGSVGSGTFEALLVTRTPLPVILTGMIGYPLLMAVTRALLLLAVGAAIGVDVAWHMLPAVAVIALLLVAAYVAFGLVAASLVLVFRTSGPLITAVTTGSMLLGGAYYSTTVIPSWLQDLSALVPLTYAVRPARMLLLGGSPLGEVASDVATLALFAVTLLAAGTLAFTAALRHARRAGTLAQY